MSSVKYAACLPVSRTLRGIVLASGALLSLSGIPIVLHWPIDAGWRVVLAIAWSAFSWRELGAMRRAYMTFCHIEVEVGGAIALGNRAHVSATAELLPGSILLGRVGWLRLKTADGLRTAELIYGNPRKNRDWRRLQVIWRHL